MYIVKTVKYLSKNMYIGGNPFEYRDKKII